MLAIGHGPESPGRAGGHLRTSDPGPSPLRQLFEHTDPRTRAKVAWEGWSTPQDLDPSTSSRDSSSTPRSFRPVPETPWTTGGTRWPSRMGPSPPGQLVNHSGPRTWTRVPGTASRARRPSNPGPSHPGQLVDIAVPPTRARVPWYIWSNRGSSEPSVSCPGGLVHPTGRQTSARVDRDSRSTMLALGPSPIRPGQQVDTVVPRTWV